MGFSQEMMDGDVGTLSGGWKMRVALARILLMRPDAHAARRADQPPRPRSLIWLEQFLKGYEGALVMTSHDREFMNRLVGKIVEIDGGGSPPTPATTTSTSSSAALNEKQQQAQFERQQAMLAKEIKFIERFKARASHAAQVQSRVKKLEKIERVEPPKCRQTVAFEFLAAAALRRGRGEPKNVCTNAMAAGASTRAWISRCAAGSAGASWGSTAPASPRCLKLVAGATPPDDGTVALGGSVKMGYFAQHAMDLLDGDQTIFQWLEDAFPQAGQGSLRTLAGCFGFSGDDVEKRCRVLSGGEKARLVMAKMLYDPPNFLVLDEPTNHLDMATKEMLITALSQYEGTMLFVSHDRHFLAALSNRLLELTPDGIHQYGGGYTEYVARTGREAPGLRS